MLYNFLLFTMLLAFSTCPHALRYTFSPPLAAALAPLRLVNALAMYGPTIGIPPANPAIVAKKSPNRTRMPYSSIKNPKKAQRIRISVMPSAKARVPFHFCRRAKKASVFCVPMMRVRPMRKRI